MQKTRVYAIRDNHWIRYVGKTIKPLEDRLAEHLLASRRGEKTYKGNGIRKILSEGRSPTVSLLEIAEGDGSIEERAWIKYFRSYGIDLWNATDGGEGISGWKCPPETKAKRERDRKARDVFRIPKDLLGWLQHHPEIADQMDLTKIRPYIGEKIPPIKGDQRFTINRVKRKGRAWTTSQRAEACIAHLGKKRSDEANKKQLASLKKTLARRKAKAERISRTLKETWKKRKLNLRRPV